MKPYDALSKPGKLRRLCELAASALSNYDLKNPALVLHGMFTNLLYRVTIPSGERFILRLATPAWRTFADLQSEALWLKALRSETSIPVPEIIPARSGEYVLSMVSPVIPGVWKASLISWVPGRLLGNYLTPLNLEKIGRLFAALHLHAASWTPPPGFTTLRFEHWLSRGEPNLILGDSASSIAGVAGLPSGSPDLLLRLHLQVEQAYASLDRSDLRVIHCDLWHNNIKLHQGVLHPLDFEDVVWGFRLHDIAMAMLDLLDATGEPRYSVLLSAFRRGYEALLHWPDGELQPFQVGRLLWKINWVTRFEPQWLPTMLERFFPVFQHYERTGELILPPPR